MIEPVTGWSLPKLSELWQYRDLLWVLTKRDLTVRYKQTAVGVVWAILQPVGLAVIFSLFLGLVFKRNPAGDIPYPVFLICGLTMWLYFAGTLPRGAQSTVSSANLISKVYFPRVLIPISSIIPPAVDFLLAFVVLIGTMLVYGLTPTTHILLAPVVFAVAMLILLGTTLLLSALTVRYRDVQLAVPFAITALLYSSAVIYPLSLLPPNTQIYMSMNPMAGVMESWRWVILPGAESPGLAALVPVVWAAVLTIAGLAYFHRTEQSFADII